MRVLLVMFALVGCGGDDGVDATPSSGTGQIHTSWALRRVDGVGVTCEQAGATKVELATYIAGGEGFADRFPCSAGEGTTGSLVAGELALYITLLDAENNVLAQAAYDERVVVVGGEITNIGPYFFDL